jgi:hypothetical protein
MLGLFFKNYMKTPELFPTMTHDNPPDKDTQNTMDTPAKRTSPLHRLAGSPDKKREEEARHLSAEMLRNQPAGDQRYKHEGTILEKLFGGKKLKDIEKPHSELDAELIAGINHHLASFVERYGGHSIDVPEQAVHFIDIHVKRLNPQTRDEMFGLENGEPGSCASGYYNTRNEAIIINDQSASSHPLARAKLLAHEMMHLESFASATLPEQTESQTLDPRRSGLSARAHDTDTESLPWHLKQLNEAVTEELTKRFLQEYAPTQDIFKKDLETTRLFKEKLEKEKHITTVDGTPISTDDMAFGIDTGDEFMYQDFSYGDERSALRTLIKTIQEKNSDRFASEEAVFDEFAKAYFAGNLLPIARLINKTYGEKSFRAVGRDLIAFIRAHES